MSTTIEIWAALYSYLQVQLPLLAYGRAEVYAVRDRGLGEEYFRRTVLK